MRQYKIFLPALGCLLVTVLLPLIPALVFADGEVLDGVITPRSTVKVGSYEEGILESVLVERGDRVKKGQIVARLDSDIESHSMQFAKLKAKTDIEIRSGKVQLRYRLKEFKRLGTLEVKSAIPLNEYDKANVEHQLAQFSLEAVKTAQRMAQLEYEQTKTRLERRTILSPVDGIVIDVTLRPGEYVHEQAPLMSIAEVDPLYVEVFVPVARYGEIQVGGMAEVMPEEPIGGTYLAKVVVVDHVFDPASRTFGVRLKLANSEYALPAGMRSRVRFLGDSDKKMGRRKEMSK